MEKQLKCNDQQKDNRIMKDKLKQEKARSKK